MVASTRPSKPQTESKAMPLIPASQTASVASRHAHDRLIFLIANCVGCPTTVSLQSGEAYAGIFSAATVDQLDSRIVLKMTKQINPPRLNANSITSKDDVYAGFGDDHVFTFEMKDVASIDVQQANPDRIQARLPNGSSFRTDTDISGNQENKQRQLQAWQDTSSSNVDMSLNGAGAAGWDQFETNRKLFGVNSVFDETLYTTAIDRSSASYKQRVAYADKLAREIQTSETDNPHVAEERNLVRPEAETMDEESKYMPPARRPPTGQPTVTGNPVDPAIISSSLARPGPESETQQSKSETATINKQKDGISDIKSPLETNTSAAAPSATPAQISPNNVESTTGPSKGDSKAVAEAGKIAKAPAKPTALTASSTRISAAAAVNTSQRNVTPNVSKELLESFREFSANEKIKAFDKHQEQIRAKKEKEREFKINDLKQFSKNFKLKSPVPHDILGIMARDKEKQKAIEHKAHQNHEEQKQAQKAMAASPEVAASPNINDRQGGKGVRPLQGQPTQLPGKPEKAANHLVNGQPVRVTGQLGSRLMQNQQNRAFQNIPHATVPESRNQTLPGSINTAVGVTRSSRVSTPNSALSNFNVQAMEFRPNPAAMSFQPVDRKGIPTSPARPRTKSVAKQHSINRVSFWGEGKRPAEGSKKSLSLSLNPFPRLQREAQQWIDTPSEEPREVKSREVESNGGIRYAYKTPPRWPVSKKMEEKGWGQIVSEALYAAQSSVPSTFPLAHAHQIPSHIQGYYGPPRTPNQYRSQSHHPGREYFEEHQRMQPGSSQSSVQPSPSIRHPMLANHQPIAFRMENGQMAYPVNGASPMTPGRQFVGGQYVVPQGAPPMMMSHSQQGQFMGMQQPGQIPMYSPVPGQIFSMQAPPHTAYASPRTAPMMVNQGSQHGQMPQQFMYQQQAGQGYPQHGQPMPMRGGVPMMQQGSYGSSQHVPHQLPQARSQFVAGNFSQQPMIPGQMMAGQMMPQQPVDR